MINRKRVYLSTSSGSITIEAAITISMFMLIVLYLMSVLTMQGKVFSKQVFLDTMSKKLSKAVYYVEVADEITDYNDTLKAAKEKIETLAKESESFGFHIKDIFYDNGNIDLKIEYPLQFPFWKHFIVIKQRSRMKDWSGTDISQSSELVYITKTGNVYHKSKECSHLNVSVRSEIYGNLSSLRNGNGGKYSPCKICVKDFLNDFSKIYVTADGNRYHTNLQCSGISRYIIEMDIGQAGDRKPCSACGG